jgi:hypothetical protein
MSINMVQSKKPRYDVDFAIIERAPEPIIVEDHDPNVQCIAVRKIVTFATPVLAYTSDDLAELEEVFELLEDPIDAPLPKRKMRALLAESPEGWVAPFVPYGHVDAVLSSVTALLHGMASGRDPAHDPYPLPEKWVFLPKGW